MLSVILFSAPGCILKGWSDKSEALFGFGSPWLIPFLDFCGVSSKNSSDLARFPSKLGAHVQLEMVVGKIRKLKSYFQHKDHPCIWKNLKKIFQLKTFQLHDLSNCPFQLHACPIRASFSLTLHFFDCLRVE